MIWIVPTITLTAFIAEKCIRKANPPPPSPPELVKVPVEIIDAGSKPRIVYVELEAESVPEPSSLLLVPASALLLARRRR